ncbi:glycosyltransferase family protein [Dickeya poaceiphila]|uniref:Glycosyltransferase family 9 protein n=1 Tax=Dickeya poaceiphila TaxID=568768 RepID=A0A5B8I4Q1_9GAMM|nr:hypothetical protein [Dickeya poaceiphila]QDX29571.1 hypothetical protein Dpoa569_0001359 [Dickeya poaceiphila]
MQKLYIDGMQGIGDNIFQRAFIKRLCQTREIYLKTSIPEFYSDLPNVNFIRSDTTLRTQRKNEQSSTIRYVQLPPVQMESRRIFYGNADLMRPGGIFSAARRVFGCEPDGFDLPKFALPDIGLPKGRKIALIRPTTERSEWHHKSRGPLNKNIDAAAKLLHRRGYFCVSVADTVPGAEWIPDLEPYADLKLHNGELKITELMALVNHADIVVTGPCLISQAALAYRTKMIFIGGGCGGSNHHSRITDASIMDLSQCLFVYPDNYCMCQEMKHNCDKRISNLTEKITGWLNEKNL